MSSLKKQPLNKSADIRANIELTSDEDVNISGDNSSSILSTPPKINGENVISTSLSNEFDFGTSQSPPKKITSTPSKQGAAARLESLNLSAIENWDSNSSTNSVQTVTNSVDVNKKALTTGKLVMKNVSSIHRMLNDHGSNDDYDVYEFNDDDEDQAQVGKGVYDGVVTDSDSDSDSCYSCPDTSASWHTHKLDKNKSRPMDLTFIYTNDDDNNSDDQGEEDNGDNGGRRKRKRRVYADPKSWEQNKAQENKLNGLQYWGFEKQGSKKVKVLREAALDKPIGECRKQSCHNLGKKCSSFSQQHLETIREKFYSLKSKQAQDEFIRSSVKMIEVKRRRVKKDDSQNFKRNTTYLYQFKLNSIWVQVCKDLYLKTLAVGEWKVRATLAKIDQEGMVEFRKLPRGKNGSDSPINKERKDYMVHWLEQIPKTESHYCRQNTDKTYFESCVPTYTLLYKLYENSSNQLNIKPMSSTFFRVYLKKNKYSLFKPKKDNSDTCFVYEKGTVLIYLFKKSPHKTPKI